MVAYSSLSVSRRSIGRTICLDERDLVLVSLYFCVEVFVRPPLGPIAGSARRSRPCACVSCVMFRAEEIRKQRQSTGKVGQVRFQPRSLSRTGR